MQNKNSLATTTNTAPSVLTSSRGRFPVRIPIRMTQEERARIGQAACALNRSISRYLVELATSGANTRTPPFSTQEEAVRVKFLVALFAGATEKVRAVLASERLNQTGQEEESENAGAKAALQEVLRLLEAVGQELGRRIR